MKKLLFGLTMLLFGHLSFGQAINDQAVIPVSVTLNSILRLTVVSGGNIDFVVNTITQYTTGINLGGANALYHTNFTVSSSEDFDVTLRAEDPSFIGQDNAASTMPLNNVGFHVTSSGTGAVPTNWTLAGISALSNTAADIVTGVGGAAAGSAAKNNFTIRWRLGTGEAPMNGTTLLAQSLDPDRYVTNVFLELVPK